MKHYTSLDISKMRRFKFATNKTHECGFINMPCAFDIETTSLYYLNNEWTVFNYDLDNDEYENVPMYSLCWVWMFGFINPIDGEYEVYRGDTIEEFGRFLTNIIDIVGRDLIIFIHNASFEFQYLRNVFPNMSVFSRKSRKVIYFTIPIGDNIIEFRCTYTLTNSSLEIMTAQNDLYKKAVGDLDYDVFRLPGAYDNLTDKEKGYCESDILSMLEWLQKKVKTYQGRYDRIPLTQTGCMRKEMRKAMAKEYKYKEDSRKLVPFCGEYLDIVPCFSGGQTGENYLWHGEIMDNLESWDLVSAYIWQIISQKYPTTHFCRWRCADLNDAPKNMLWVASVTFYNIVNTQYFPYISVHKCSMQKRLMGDNGKLMFADEVTITITNVDWDIIKLSYNIGEIKVNWMRAAKCDYLNNIYRLKVLEFFSKKETLKKYSYHGSPNFDYQKNEEFMRSKEYLNSTYGANVTNLVCDEILFINNQWDVDLLTPVKVKAILDDMRSKPQLFRYTTGLFIPLYNKHGLMTTLYQIGRDAVYIDTDSIKCPEGYNAVFEAYNARVEEEARRISDDATNPITYDMLCPNGRLLGTFEMEGKIDKFTSYGSKKYCCQYGDKIEITVAGLGKKAAEGTITDIREFKKGRKWGYKESGRMTAYYLDNMPPIVLDGKRFTYKYGVVLRPTTYVLGVTDEYTNLLNAAKDDFNRSGSEFAMELFKKGERIIYD